MLKCNNRIKALEFYKHETNEQLKDTWKVLAMDKPTMRNMQAKILAFFELFPLLIHRCSNAHGTLWVRGIIFLFVTTFVIYLGFINSLLFFPVMKYEKQLFFEYYFRFVIPTHKLGFGSSNFQLGPWSTSLDILGRIFSSYGIYQIVQAFRKYGKQ